MLAPDQTVTELTLPAVDVRALARRASVPALAVLAVAGVVVLGGGPIHAFADAVGRGLDSSPQWALLGIGFECVSLAGYVALLSLVATRATPRIGARESAQITLAGAAATRLLPTAGAGGAALAMWALRRAGLRPAMAARTLLAFLVVLYSVFLAAIVVSGATLALGLVASRGPLALSALPALAAMLAIMLALAFASRRGVRPDTVIGDGQREQKPSARVRAAPQLIGGAVRDAFRRVRTRGLRLAGA